MSEFHLISVRRDRRELLRQGEYVVGRAKTADIQLNDSKVSRHHAKLYVGPEGIVVEDLMSSSGCYVDGLQVGVGRPFPPGALFTIGDFLFTLIPDTWLSVEPPFGPCPDTINRVDLERPYRRWRQNAIERIAGGWDDELDIRLFDILQADRDRLLWLRDHILQGDTAAWIFGRTDNMLLRFSYSDNAAELLILLDISEQSRRYGPLALGHLQRRAREKEITIATLIFDRLAEGVDYDVGLLGRLFWYARFSAWSVEQFEKYMKNDSFREAAEDIVFVATELDGSRRTFRPSDDELINASGDPISPRGELSVLIARSVTESERVAWQEHLAEYEVVQPFDQFAERH